ncbi:CCA tRNA nucleotidyltransferase [Bacillus sp. CGMCC 1.16607]|uniref:CCA tRNA nucleotidyltransferase n=1 Tax=Bacillus sp. CGMCC 1.16607 TaxID=3351842 RepID=UPI0036382330
MLQAFQDAVPILDKIEEAGFEAYFVGGSVRDYLLKKEIDDVDIATSATPEEIKCIFQKTIDVGIEHGTVIVLYNGKTYEVTTFRSESNYVDFRRPKDVTFIRSLYEDLKRRDFTMNAIAMDRFGKVIDPFNGHSDIKRKLIQTVGKAEERFSEDALRMMRAVRFVSQLSFDIEIDTFAALRQFGPLLMNISIERKTKEFEKLLTGKNRNKALEILLKAELNAFLPGLKDEEKAIRKTIAYSLSHLKLTEMWTILLFTLNLSVKESKILLKEWKLSNQKIKEIEKISNFLSKRFLQNWSKVAIYQSGIEVSMSVERIYNVINGIQMEEQIDKLKSLYNELPIKELGDLVVTGQDIMNWNMKPGGPWVKELLMKIEQEVLLGNILNEKEAIREWQTTCNPK